MRPLRRRSQHRDMRRHIAGATQALRSLPRRTTYIMVRGIPCEGKRDSSSESGQTGAIKAIPYLGYTPYTKGSMRRVRGKLAGRPLGAVNKARTINRDTDQSIFSFTSQVQSMRGASEAPVIIPPTHSTEHSQMDCDAIQAEREAQGIT